MKTGPGLRFTQLTAGEAASHVLGGGSGRVVTPTWWVEERQASPVVILREQGKVAWPDIRFEQIHKALLIRTR